jgi:chromate reductase
MSDPYRVAVLVGSLRRGSLNRMMANTAREAAPASLTLVDAAIGDLPLYNQDLDTDSPPAAWKRFRDEVRPCDAVLFVTPEYNRSVPGLLKNAIDVGSRPYGQSVWSGKPAAVISVSPGALGAFGANQHIRQSFVFLDMPVLQQPEAYIGNAAKLFDEQGRMTNADTRDFVRKYMAAFEQWIAKTARKR